ncbi:FKBP-type peptidyl-prolyl cis-trans isomerase [Ekhidna sp.]|uniref:FKBP-type peptidyl-prolyl cis-trans isomerase n=1 Tax=Ekhidna sp. TaxID=2608089 RepID=UPI003B50A878
MNKYPFIIILIVGLIISSCGGDDSPVTSIDQEVQVWLDSAGISATRDDNTGIYYYSDLTNTSGTAASAGSVASIYYTLSDLDGNVIASHQRSDGDSLTFKVGASAVYPVGVDFAVGLMRAGEVFNFILPPAQAYQELTSGAISPNTIVHLQVELVDVNTEANIFAQDRVDIRQYIATNFLDSLAINPTDSTEEYPTGIVYKRRRIGTGSVPMLSDTIIVDYTGRFLDDSGFDSGSGFQWIYGSDTPRELLGAFEFGVSLMQTNEQALIMIPSDHGYRESALIVPASITDDLIVDEIIPDYVASVPPYRVLLFEITRVD